MATRNSSRTADAPPLICDRCARILRPGSGDFYVVKIEAVADPTPPEVTLDDLGGDIEGEIERLLAALEQVSPQEARDQVYRRFTIFLCRSCYEPWIENPAGQTWGT